jgi:uncharacterized protein (DUF2267 family)
MSQSNVTALNHAVENAQAWLKDLRQDGSFASEEQAYTALRAVLQSLRNRLTVDRAAQLTARLPKPVRDFY